MPSFADGLFFDILDRICGIFAVSLGLTKKVRNLV